MADNYYEQFLEAYADKTDVPVWVKNLYKTLASKNITLEDWNTLVTQARNISAESEAIYEYIKALEIQEFVISVQGPNSPEPHQGVVVLSLNDDFGITLTPEIINALPAEIDTKVDKVAGQGLSDTNFTQTEKTKLGGIANNAQVNVLEHIKINNGSNLGLTDKTANIVIPTQVSDLEDDVIVNEAHTASYDSQNNLIVSTYVKKTDIKNELSSDDTDKPLSAKQGKILDASITELSNRVSAHEGIGGFLDAHDFGKILNSENPADQNALFAYALTQIPSIDGDRDAIWNGTRVTNLYDNTLWVLSNTPPINEWSNSGPANIGKASETNYGYVRGGGNVKINSAGDMNTTPEHIGAYSQTDGDSLEQDVYTQNVKTQEAVEKVNNAVANMEATLGLEPLWDAEGENELLDAEEEYLLSVAHIDANSINGREFYVMSKAEHAALIQAGTYIPDAFYLTF